VLPAPSPYLTDVSFNALIILIWWQEGHLDRKKLCHLSRKVYF